MAARFLLAIEGVDAEPVRRKGDISATGLYFDTDEDVGDVGTVHFLQLASIDGLRSLRTMAHVVRKVHLTVAGGVSVRGAALEFMPESEQAICALEEFVHGLLTSPGEEGDEPRVPAAGLHARDVLASAAASAQQSAAIVRELSVRTMTIETNWKVIPGELVRVEIAAPGSRRRVCLEGIATRVEPTEPKGDGTAPPFHVAVEFQAEIRRPERLSSTFGAVQPEVAASTKDNDEEVSRALDDLFAAIIHPAPMEARPPTQHLSGLVSRIRLPTLCSLFEMEGLSGELTLRRGKETTVIYVSRGRIVDVAPRPEGIAHRSFLGQLMAWTDGTFDFDMKPVDREDAIGVGTTALLLDLARETDEANAGEDTSGDFL